MDADESAQKSQDIADWVDGRLGNLQSKMDQLPDDVDAANRALDVADDASKFVVCGCLLCGIIVWYW